MADRYIDQIWHYHDCSTCRRNPTRHRRGLTGTLTLTVSGNIATASFSGTGWSTFSDFGYPSDHWTLYISDGSNTYNVGEGNTSGKENSGNHSLNISGSHAVSGTTITAFIEVKCQDTTCNLIGTFPSVSVNSYTAPDYWMNWVDGIHRVEETYNYSYKINGGTNGLNWVDLRLPGGNPDKWAIGTGKGDDIRGSFVPRYSQGYGDGRTYDIYIAFDDGAGEKHTNHLQWRTYQKPSFNNSLSIKTTPCSAANSNEFYFGGENDRAHGDAYEQNFQTRWRISRNGGAYTGWTSLGNLKSKWTRTAAEMRALVPKSYDGQTCTLQMERYSPSANWESDNKPTVSFVVYYRPRAGVTCSNISLKKNGPSGGTITKGDLIINDSSLTGIYVTWNYDTTLTNAGYTQGYRIRIYNTGGGVVKTYYTTSKSYTVPKADIPKMQDTYIDVTPYFGNDQPSNANSSYAGNYWYYNSPTKCDFVVMAARLAKPQITYPVNNSEWINNRFRVCFQLPTDPDKGSELETYHYEDIELQINGNYTYRLTSNPQAMTTTGNCYQSAGVFSALSSNLTYQRKIVAAPCLGTNFPTTPTTYTIRVRVKKKYTTSKKNWSEWSNTVTVKVKPAVFNPSRGDTIYASHYNNAKKTIDRVRKTYSVAWSNQPANVVAKQTKILRTQYPYSNWYDRIVATKKQVNNYATFDSGRSTVKFDHVNAIIENFTQYIELVTAASNENKSDASGRNYMKIVYDRCNRLI